MSSDLHQLRAAINTVDGDILDLLQRRAALAQRVFECKHSRGEADNSYRPEREAEVLDLVLQRKLEHHGAEGLQAEHLRAIYREIISACLSLEQQIKVAYLGPEGTFTQAAALKNFGHSCVLTPLVSIPQIFREVSAGKFNFGVIPVENSNEGMVSLSLRLLEQSDLKIIGEVVLPIHQNLLAPAGVVLADVQRVYAHQQSLAQCQNWLSAHMPRAQSYEMPSNAAAAQEVAGRADSAALAAAVCSELYGLSILASDIEDNSNNLTRFVVIGDYAPAAGAEDKSSFVMTAADNQPGALYKLLKCFYDEQLDMTRLESHPMPNSSWQYKFFIDCRGHIDDPPLQRCFRALQQHSSSIKHLGSYPAARG